jgi:hypothetical protein
MVVCRYRSRKARDDRRCQTVRHQMQAVFRLVALYESRPAFGTCPRRVLKYPPAPRSGPGRYGPADSLPPFAIAHELAETGDRPLILPVIVSYGHPALSRVDFNQTVYLQAVFGFMAEASAGGREKSKGGQDDGTYPSCAFRQAKNPFSHGEMGSGCPDYDEAGYYFVRARGSRRDYGANRKIPVPESPETQPQPLLLIPAILTCCAAGLSGLICPDCRK